MINDKLLNNIILILKKKKLKIATAESCTGGLLANSFTDISGSSEYFDRGVISYSNKSKTQLLDVPEDLIRKYGAVSELIAEKMAESIRKKSNVDIGLSTTGIAGPTGGTKEKPVGLVYIAVSIDNKTIVEKHIFLDNRIGNKVRTCNAIFKLLHKTLIS